MEIDLSKCMITTHKCRDYRFLLNDDDKVIKAWIGNARGWQQVKLQGETVRAVNAMGLLVIE